MNHFHASIWDNGTLMPIIVVTLAMLIPIVAIITDYFQKKSKMRLMEKAIEHGANLDDFKLEEADGESQRQMPYRGGMVTLATGVGILIGAKYMDIGAGELNTLMMVGGAIVICVGMALLANDFMNRDRFRQE
ncbi:MAG: hypothetical protein GY838_14095 [bacterium]|nr:hypothetical protein [bacterium]